MENIKLETIPDIATAIETADAQAGLVSATCEVANSIRAALALLSPTERLALRAVLDERQVTSQGVTDLLAAPSQPRLTTPVLPFAEQSNFQALAQELTLSPTHKPVRPKYPQGVQPHLDSHQAQLTDSIARGEIPAQFEGVLRTFIELHDRGYAGAKEAMSADEYEADRTAFETTYQDVGATADQAAAMANYVLSGLRDVNPVRQHLFGRVIGHGVNSVRYGREILVRDGKVSPEHALALTKLFATHHLGYPLTPLVDGFAKILGGEIPAELRRSFLIGGDDVPMTQGDQPLSPQEREAMSQDRADVIRAEIADEVAPVLGISQADSRAIAAIGYSLDRTTPARRMTDFTLNDDNTIAWSGGETEKRYPLIVSNLDAMYRNTALTTKPEKSLQTVYTLSITQFEKERDAALRTATNLQVPGLDEVIRRISARNIMGTLAVQQRALEIANRLGVGSFATIAKDIEQVRTVYRESMANRDATIDRDALGYLLGTLTVMQGNITKLFPNG